MRLFYGRGTRVASALLSLSIALSVVFTVGATVGSDAFERTWDRTDRPVAAGQVDRTWMWGPWETAFERIEPYVDSPDGERQVMYFDKSRMEVTDPTADQSSPWFVTNGLLSQELITGEMQTGDATFEQREPAQVNVAGDAGDPTGPTYATFGAVLDASPLAVGAAITQRIDRAGTVTDEPELVEFGVTAGVLDDVTNHTVAEPFWNFMTSVGVVWEDEAFTIAPLFESYLYVTGRPITEAYWANVQVAGEYQDVLMQCFERRCLTYTPGNSEGWQVEAGNVGQHYFTWRYGDDNGNGGEPLPGDPEVGAEVFLNKGCAGCHSMDNETRSGPPLNGLYGNMTLLADGTSVLADEAYLRESILDPDAKIVMGYVPMMPTIPVTDQELDDLVSYLMVSE